MQPPAEHVHWLFATGFLLLGLCLLAEGVVGTEVWQRRAWRASAAAAFEERVTREGERGLGARAPARSSAAAGDRLRANAVSAIAGILPSRVAI